jgi:hypothetical protein
MDPKHNCHKFTKKLHWQTINFFNFLCFGQVICRKFNILKCHTIVAEPEKAVTVVIDTFCHVSDIDLDTQSINGL